MTIASDSFSISTKASEVDVCLHVGLEKERKERKRRRRLLQERRAASTLTPGTKLCAAQLEAHIKNTEAALALLEDWRCHEERQQLHACHLECSCEDWQTYWC